MNILWNRQRQQILIWKGCGRKNLILMRHVLVISLLIQFPEGWNMPVKDGLNDSVVMISVCLPTHLVWVTHPQHPGHLSPWKRAIRRLISIQAVTPGEQTSPVTAAKAHSWYIVVNLLDNPQKEPEKNEMLSRGTKQQVVVVRWRVELSAEGRLWRKDKRRWRPSFPRQEAADFHLSRTVTDGMRAWRKHSWALYQQGHSKHTGQENSTVMNTCVVSYSHIDT